MKRNIFGLLVICALVVGISPKAQAFDLGDAIRSEIGDDVATATDNLSQYVRFSGDALRVINSPRLSGAQKTDRIAAQLQAARRELDHQCVTWLSQRTIHPAVSYHLTRLDHLLAQGKLVELRREIEKDRASMLYFSNVLNSTGVRGVK